MNRKILIAIGVIATALVAGLLMLYQDQLSGIWPTILDADEDIARLIEENNATTTEEATSTETATSTKLDRTAQQGPLVMPRGFSISVFAKDLKDPRVLTFDPSGILLASIPSQGKVVALIDKNNDGVSEATRTVTSGLDHPHGIAIRCDQQGACKLYVAETEQVDEFAYDPATQVATDKRVVGSLPGGGGHSTRTLLPHGNSLLVSVGSSCNVCRESDQERAKILEMSIDTGAKETFATGLRNAVFMAFHPRTEAIWATEMGRDLLGDDIPPDEINIIKKGTNYGWPTCYGKNVHDTEFDKNVYFRNPCMEPFETPSHIDVPAHSAPLGLAFVPDSWPAEYRDDLLVAYHGSWNRSVPTGYKIVRYRLDENGAYQGVEDFMTGWLTPSGTALGRPVAIIFDKNGAAYISDDKAGVIYRLVPPRKT